MAAAISVRDDFDGPALRSLAKCTKHSAQARRLLALAEICDGGFQAIIAEQNPTAHPQVVTVDDVDEQHPLMVSAHTWEVERVGTALASAFCPFLKSAKSVLFVDRFFDISKARYQETLRACLAVIQRAGRAGVRCEIHFCDHDNRPPPEFIERDAHKWIRGVLPAGMSFALFGWRERAGGADFHARYLLTDVGGLNVEAGFSAEGAHQKVQLGLLPLGLAQNRLNALVRNSTVYASSGRCWKSDLTARFIGFESSSAGPGGRHWVSSASRAWKERS